MSLVVPTCSVIFSSGWADCPNPALATPTTIATVPTSTKDALRIPFITAPSREDMLAPLSATGRSGSGLNVQSAGRLYNTGRWIALGRVICPGERSSKGGSPAALLRFGRFCLAPGACGSCSPTPWLRPPSRRSPSWATSAWRSRPCRTTRSRSDGRIRGPGGQEHEGDRSDDRGRGRPRADRASRGRHQRSMSTPPRTWGSTSRTCRAATRSPWQS